MLELCGHLNAGHYRFLTLIAEFDRDEHWTRHGLANCAHWLRWQCGLGTVAAREHVRTARALERLPKISEAFSRGQVSYSKVREMSRIATPESEPALLNVALYGTSTHVERLVRGYRRVERLEAAAESEERYRQRHVHYRYDEDGSLIIHAKLPPEVGDVVKKAIEAAVEALYQDGMRQRKAEEEKACADPNDPEPEKGAAAPIETESNVPAGTAVLLTETPVAAVPAPAGASSAGAEVSKPRALFQEDRSCAEDGRSAVEEVERESWCESLGRRRADALRLLAEGFLASDPKPGGSAADRYQVVVHIDQTLLVQALRETMAEPDSKERATASRHEHAGEPHDERVCGARVHRLERCEIEDEAGEPLSVRRKTRAISPALNRALRTRDGGCRFPGDGGFEFFRPDGTRIEENGYERARGGFPADGARSLFRLNRRRGLEIDAKTAACRWGGERMDYGLAVEHLFHCRDRAPHSAS